LSITRLVVIVGAILFAVVLVAVLLLALALRDPSAEEVVQAFRDEGLEVGEVQPIRRELDRSFLPKIYEEQVRFSIPSQGENIGGRVFTFESQEDLEQVREHYEGFGGPFFSYVYVEGNVLVQLPGEVPEDQADRYGEVLQEM
jgi:hypothetical protein